MEGLLGATLGIPGHSRGNSWKRTRDLSHAKIQLSGNPTQRYFWAPPLPPSKFFVFAFSYISKRTKQPEHKEFQGLKAPKTRWIQAGDSCEIFLFRCLFGPEIPGATLGVGWPKFQPRFSERSFF